MRSRVRTLDRVALRNANRAKSIEPSCQVVHPDRSIRWRSLRLAESAISVGSDYMEPIRTRQYD
jgi:hypothetical protein